MLGIGGIEWQWTRRKITGRSLDVSRTHRGEIVFSFRRFTVNRVYVIFGRVNYSLVPELIRAFRPLPFYAVFSLRNDQISTRASSLESPTIRANGYL